MSCGWFYNDISGRVRYDCGIAYLVDVGTVKTGLAGWHGPYKTQAEANAHEGTSGATPTTSDTGALTNAATQSLIPALFTQRTFAVRIVEVVLGGLLVYLGIRELL
jgi:hypothetical protein